MYGVVANYIRMSNFQLCYSPSTYLQTSVPPHVIISKEYLSLNPDVCSV